MEAIGKIALTWAAGHQQLMQGIVLGWAASHPRVIVRSAFNLAMRLPAADDFVKKHGPALHAWVKEGSDELIRDIDAKAEESKPETPAQ